MISLSAQLHSRLTGLTEDRHRADAIDVVVRQAAQAYGLAQLDTHDLHMIREDAGPLTARVCETWCWRIYSARARHA